MATTAPFFDGQAHTLEHLALSKGFVYVLYFQHRHGAFPPFQLKPWAFRYFSPCFCTQVSTVQNIR